MSYFPEVVQTIPTEDYKVYVYFSDGTIKLYDASKLITRGVFKKIADIKVFIETCTVLNNTLAWTVDKSYNEETCLDIDPISIYKNSVVVDEPLHLLAK